MTELCVLKYHTCLRESPGLCKVAKNMKYVIVSYGQTLWIWPIGRLWGIRSHMEAHIRKTGNRVRVSLSILTKLRWHAHLQGAVLEKVMSNKLWRTFYKCRNLWTYRTFKINMKCMYFHNATHLRVKFECVKISKASSPKIKCLQSIITSIMWLISEWN